ncbi:retrotransposon protein [Canna indica]|uniref:Retrotransposon protein n=1 Tax=Canna indica TaxID=4628 RepID=A0AAQ3K1M3_9LILI|nr:retrotransposon protein [Canna indica]
MFLSAADDRYIIGGDLNVTCFDAERRNFNGLAGDSALLSSLISDRELVDLPIKGKAFTWSNNRPSPCLARLDRILISLPTSVVLPLASVMGGEKRLSYHNALIFESRIHVVHKNKPFRLEHAWFSYSGFCGIISASWNASRFSNSASSEWILRWRKLRKLIPQWASSFKKEYSTKRLLLEREVDGFAMGLNGMFRDEKKNSQAIPDETQV